VKGVDMESIIVWSKIFWNFLGVWRKTTFFRVLSDFHLP